MSVAAPSLAPDTAARAGARRRMPSNALWARRDAIVCLVLVAVGVVLWFVAWFQAAGEVSFEAQRGPLNLAVVGVLVGCAGFGLWFVRGRRAIGVRRRALIAHRRALLRPATAEPQAAQTLRPRSHSTVLVAGEALARYHRADCPLVAGRDWPAALRGEHEAAGRRACGVCLS